MSDPVADTKPKPRWMWVGVIVLLAVAAVIMFINPDGDEDLETVPDYAVTTQEERLNQPIREDADISGIPLEGEDPTLGDDVIVAEGDDLDAQEPAAQ